MLNSLSPCFFFNRQPQLKLLAACLMLTLVSFGAHAVILKDLILFSAVKGRVLDHGKPAVGLRIQRETFWNMEQVPREEFTTTDSEGYFSFPEMRATANFGFLAKLFHVPTVSQWIYVHKDGQEIATYVHSRGNYDPNTETGYPEIQFSCDFASKRTVGEKLTVLDCDVRKSR